MAIIAGRKYDVVVSSAELIESENTGTPGIQLMLECEDGQIDHTMWLTERTIERVKEDMGVIFGVNENEMARPVFLQNLNSYLQGKECSITTIEDEYKNKKRVRVEWLNKKRAKVSGSLVSRVSSLFGGGAGADRGGSGADRAASGQPVTAGGPGDDDDVPF